MLTNKIIPSIILSTRNFAMKIAKPNEQTTLLLDFSWMPTAVISARASFTHSIRGRVKPLDAMMVPFNSYFDWADSKLFAETPVMRSADNVWPIPTVVVVTDKFFRKTSKRRKLLTVRELANIFDNTCQYCLQKFPLRELTIDHVKPRALGGSNSNSNRTLACKQCNCRKGHAFPYTNVKGDVVSASTPPPFVINPKVLRNEWEPFLKTTVYAKHFENELD